MNCNEKKKILVLDDDKSIGDAISEVLNDMPIPSDIHAVSEIDHAMSLLKNEEYSVIFSDIHLNSYDGQTGIDFIRAVMSTYGEKYQKRIIVLSGDHEKVKDAIKHGAFFALTKPFDVDDLKEKVEKILLD